MVTCVCVCLQEAVVKALSERLGESTLRSFLLAEQLSSNLTSLNVLIEGTLVSEGPAWTSSTSDQIKITNLCVLSPPSSTQTTPSGTRTPI